MNFSSAQILDLVVLAVLAGAAIIGAINGFFKSIIGVAVIGGSIFLGSKLGPLAAPKAIDWIYPHISDKVLAFANKRGIIPADLTPAQTDDLLKSLMKPAGRVVCGIIIAILCMILFGFLGTLIEKGIDSAPVIKGTNKLLGALMGVILAFLVFYILVFAFSKLGMGDYLAGKFEGSIAYRFLYSCVPNSEDAIGINLPYIGELDLKSLFKK